MVGPGGGLLVGHHHNVRDDLEQLCLRIAENIVKEAKQVYVEKGLDW